MDASVDGPSAMPESAPTEAAPDQDSGVGHTVDPDLSAAVSYSLAQTVETRLRGIRNYTRLLREAQRQD